MHILVTVPESPGGDVVNLGIPSGLIMLVCCCRAFNQLIGDLNELREKDYGDEARGAQRYKYDSLTVHWLDLGCISLLLPRLTKLPNQWDSRVW